MRRVRQSSVAEVPNAAAECAGCVKRAHGMCRPNAADVPNAPMEKICKSPFTVVKYTIYM